MNLEFHYYTIYLLCKEAGFDDSESHIIAYSSQYIDNNLSSIRVETGKGIYETIPTQNYGWWDDYFPKNVYIPFHFFPGDTEYEGSRRKDGRKNPLNTTPGSARVKELLITGLKTRNPYRVGIALHTYADSWAHQNFSGYEENWNVVRNDSLIPGIGHAQVLTSPDGFTGTWQDSRLTNGYESVDNKTRFLEAARMIYKYLSTYNRKGFDDHENVIQRLGLLTRGDSREERILNYIIEEDIIKYDKYEWYREAVYDNEAYDDGNGFVGYDKVQWLKDAFLYRTALSRKPVKKAREDFYSSHYYQWSEAAREHLKAAKNIVKDLI
ncbi:MAG: hypothetical protein JW969_07880 [Spirochaetales bacterium]|nr:hypothetical protein [Spirochaetales bacterium]